MSRSRLRRRARWVGRGFGAFVFALLMVAAIGYMWLRTSLPETTGRILVAGLDSDVEIVRDAVGVPHIRAGSERDAYFALGFVHAQDRLWQMETMRRTGAGRLSEFAGTRTLALDRSMRTLGLYRLAQRSYDIAAPEVRAAVDAYTSGVNAYLHTRSGALPPEFQLSRHTPEPWTAADSLVWGRLMALRLTGNWREEALRAKLADRLSPVQIAELFPPYEHMAPPTLAALRPEFAPAFAALHAALPDLGFSSASNSWVVGGALTGTGKPLLAGDPHLGFEAPNLWYLARIDAPGLSLAGATVPGVPFHILGHNGDIAWTFTTTDSDTQDLFIERLDPTDPTRYLTPDGARPFVTREDVIRVRGADDVRITVRETRHGPVLSDTRPDFVKLESGHVIAAAAAALAVDDRTAEAIYRLNHARDWSSFVTALEMFHAPQQNVTYADTAGNIGFIAPGRVPIRRAGEGLVPVPGWTGAHDWIGYVPFAALPRSFNPPAGRIVNANHKIVDDAYPYFLGHGWTPAYRARRIHEILDAQNRHDAEGFASAQHDAHSLASRELLPLLLETLPAAAAHAPWRAMLARWDGVMRRDRAEPLLFTAWLRALNRLLYADELGPHFSDVFDLNPIFVRNVLNGKFAWCDDVTTPARESCATIVAMALEQAVSELTRDYGSDAAAWRWGTAHYANFRHVLFSTIPILRAIATIRTDASGDAYTINRGQTRISDERAPYASVHGAGFRAVYDLADLDASLFIQAPGQSGNLLSPHYRDLIGRWRDGTYLRLIPRSSGTIAAGELALVLTSRAPR